MPFTLDMFHQKYLKKKKTGQTDLPRKKKKPVINGSFKKKIQKKTGLLKSFVRIFFSLVEGSNEE